MTLTQIKPAGLSKPVDLADAERIRLGTGNDLQIYHDSSNSVIDNQTGYLVVKSSASGEALYLQGQTVMGQPSGGGDVYFSGHKDGAFKAYYDNSLKIETTSIGVTVSGDLKLPDGEELRLGTGNDIQIYHDGTHSYIENNTGNLRIRNNGTLKTAQFEVDQVDFNDSANTEVRVRIGSDGLKLLVDGDKIHIGNGADLQLYHDGTFNYIAAPNNHEVHINANSGGSTENMAKFKPNGAVELYYDNSKKFTTDSNGFYCPNNGEYIAVSSNGQTASGRFGYHENYKLYIENVRGAHTKMIWDNDGKIRAQITDGSNLQDRLVVTANGTTLTGLGNTTLTINTGNNSGDNSQLAFGDSADADVGFINYDHGTNSMQFRVNASEALRIDSSGRIKINHTDHPGQLDNTFISIHDTNGGGGISKNYAMMQVNNYGTGNPGDLSGIGFGAGAGNAYIKGSIGFMRTGSYGQGDFTFNLNTDSSSALVNDTDEVVRIRKEGGITFNGDTAAVNALDDYEEGTWTAELRSHSTISSTTGHDTTENFAGWYTKIGDMVTVSVVCANIHNNHKNHVLRSINNLPFTSAGSTAMPCSASAHIGEMRGLRFVYASSIEESDNFSMWGQIGNSTTQISLHASKHTSPYGGWPATFNVSGQSMKLGITITYKAA